ncbi:MAG: hypothetical protein ACLR4Z_00840 [Butyricicoccaceae bacterium]
MNGARYAGARPRRCGYREMLSLIFWTRCSTTRPKPAGDPAAARPDEMEENMDNTENESCSSQTFRKNVQRPARKKLLAWMEATRLFHCARLARAFMRHMRAACSIIR